MTDLPTIQPDGISPNSPYHLSPSAAFVVAETGDDGLLLILSQHRSSSGAATSRKRVGRDRRLPLSSWPRIYRVNPTGGLPT